MSISNKDDIIDSIDVIERIEELETSSEEDDELQALIGLRNEAAHYSVDWEYGAILIKDSYFREYARQRAEDIGALDYKPTWPHNCIDWDQAARQLKMDYTLVSFNGVDYWIE